MPDVLHFAPHPALGNSRFIAFFDECGDHSLVKIDPDFPVFVLALVVAERAAYRDDILAPFNAFKLRYFNDEGINPLPPTVPVKPSPTAQTDAPEIAQETSADREFSVPLKP